MARGKTGSLSTTGAHQEAIDIKTKRAERLELFVNTVNHELEEMEYLIVNSDEEGEEEST